MNTRADLLQAYYDWQQTDALSCQCKGHYISGLRTDGTYEPLKDHEVCAREQQWRFYIKTRNNHEQTREL